MRDLEEILVEGGVVVDHAALSRWVVKFPPPVASAAHKRKKPGAVIWRMDETYKKNSSQWMYLYRSVDRAGETLDFMRSESRYSSAATQFFARDLASSGVLSRILTDNGGATAASNKGRLTKS